MSERPDHSPERQASDGVQPSERAVSNAALSPVLRALGERALDADGVLFLTDFDGTLAPIVEEPDEAMPLDGVPETLRDLRRADGGETAVISGRALDDLRPRLEVDEIGYAGNHGLELRHDGETIVHPSARDAREVIQSLADDFADELADVDGCRVVDKRVTATVHHRLVDDERVPEIRRTVREMVARHDADLRTTTGKEIVEVRPGIDWNKGDAVDWLRERIVPEEEDWFVAYVGDDRTDEDAFEALSDGVGIKVGREQETAADYRIDDPRDARAIARWIAGPGRRLASSDGRS